MIVYKGKKNPTNSYLPTDIILIKSNFFLMSSKNPTIQQAREFLKQEALKEIYEINDFNRFHTRVFCVIAKYGLQLNAKIENLLSGDEWSNPACKEMLIKRVELFLDKHIK